MMDALEPTRSDDPGLSVPALSITGVTAGYDGSAVLRDVTVEVRPNEVVALLGPNGAGKTTLLRVASGLLEPRTGAVHLEGSDITALRPWRRRQLGLCLIPEGRGIFPSLTVLENLLVQARRAERSAVVDRVCEVFPVLRDRLGQRAGNMSGGQQQMLALARCYARQSRVVLIDEVSMGLAPLVVDQAYSALKVLREAGVAMLLVEQYVDRALELSDAVYVLTKGTARSLGPPSSVDRDQLHRGYLGATASPGGPGEDGGALPTANHSDACPTNREGS